MAFPYTDLPLMFEAAFGADPEASPGSWTFTSLTSRHLDSVTTLKEGHRAGSKTADPSAVAALFDNDDGELTPLRALSTHYPNIKLDTPFRTKLRRADDTFTRTTSNGFGTSDTGHAWSTAGGAASAYSTTGTEASIAVSATNSDRIAVVDIDGPHQDVRVTITANATPVGGSIEAGVVARYTDASNFYAAVANISQTTGIIQLKIVKALAGVLSTVTSMFPGLVTGTNKLMRFKVAEDRLQAKIWLTGTDEPDDWDLDVFDTSLTTGDLAGIYARRGSSNSTPTTITFDAFDTTHIFLEGFTDSWKPDFIMHTGGCTSVVRVTASGPLRRLGQGAEPLRSPMFRSMAGAGSFPPLAYWALEDGPSATAGAAATPATPPITVTGTVEFAADSTLISSEPLLTMDAGSFLTVPIPAYTDVGQWIVQFAMKVDAEPAGTARVAEIALAPGGYFSALILDLTPGSPSQLDLTGYDAAGAALGGQVVPLNGTSGRPTEASFYGRWFLYSLSAYESGANQFAGIGLADDEDVEFVGGVGNPGVNTAITTCRLLAGEGISIGHVKLITDLDPSTTATNNTDALTAAAAAIRGWAGEEDQDRLARLCEEENVPFQGLPGFTGVPMGPQLIDTFMANVLDCETTGQGTVGEGNFGLTYIPRRARINRPVGITTDLATYDVTSGKAKAVLAPIFDDKDFRNHWEVSRPGGSSAVAADFSRVALEYGDSATPNVETDSQLGDDGGWRLALSSVETMRWAGTPIDLAANPEMIGLWLGAMCGLTRVVRTGMPSIGPDGDQDEFLEGVEHTIRRRSWDLTYVGSPAKVYTQIGVWGSNATGTRFGASNTVLAEDLTAVETAADVTATGETWITTASHPSRFPFDVTIGGLVYSCTAITGTTPNYTFTLSRLATDKTHTAGDPVTVTNTGRYGP